MDQRAVGGVLPVSAGGCVSGRLHPASAATSNAAYARWRRCDIIGDENNVYPTLFRIGTFEVTSFGVLVAIGALVGIWIFQRELARSGLPQSGVDGALAGVFGGLVGAKVLWTIEHARRGE